MRYHALACDYDGTLALHGSVDEDTIESLQRLRSSGRKLILVTGRQMDDLLKVFPHTDLFDRIVAENGALVYRPGTREEVVLAAPPPDNLVAALQERGISPVSTGKVIIATWEPHHTAALEVIRDLSLEMQVIFNKGAVMLLPSGVNKATGLRAALLELGLSRHNVAGIGDAENDHALLKSCECSVAVANAVDSLKEHADLVTRADHGAGVSELIDRLIASDLCELDPRLTRHHVLAGKIGEQPITLSPFGSAVMITGTSGGGKTTLAAGILERLVECEYQFCIIDPEGDYERMDNAVVVGDGQRIPAPGEVAALLSDPRQNAVANLLGVELAERPSYLRSLLGRLQELRSRTGRPHWLILDEVHHLIPVSSGTNPVPLPAGQSMLLLTVRPDSVSPLLLSGVDTVMAIGEAPEQCIRSFAGQVGEPPPALGAYQLEPRECLLWRRGEEPVVIQTIPPSAERRRHRRKYAEGELGEDRSFYFRGPDQKLNLRVQNLILFMQIAQGVGDDVWLYHLRRGDYSAWFQNAIKDNELAAETAAVERQIDLSAAESRELIENAIRTRYTAPVEVSAN
jgi:hydroxymethylpyrimidine pyrophosphatase-like HAD family hydrolase